MFMMSHKVISSYKKIDIEKIAKNREDIFSNKYHLLHLFIFTKFCFFFNPIALRKAKIIYNFGLSECNRVNH